MKSLLFGLLAALLFYLHGHPRIQHRCKRRSTDSTTPEFWERYCSSLVFDYSIISIICTSLISASGWVLYCVGDTTGTIAGVTAIAACVALVGFVHASCIIWHVQSLRGVPDASDHWCKVTDGRGRYHFAQTGVLLAAPVAWMLWALAWFILLICFVIQHSPIPIYFDGLPGATHPSYNPRRPPVAQLCKPQATQLSIDLSPPFRITVTVILLLGALHVGFNMFYFTMLGVPQKDDAPQDAADPEHGKSVTLPHSSSQHSGVSPRLGTEGPIQQSLS